MRVWLYRIATNACLTALEQRTRRALPSGLGAPETDPDAPANPADPGTEWLQPLPDSDPATIVTAHEDVRLALVAGLQYLPARQRAILILREVLGFPAAEVAEMLGTSVPAVKSSLQRARASLDQVTPGEATEPRGRELLDLYIAGFENADMAALERALRSDAAIEMVGTRTWFEGRDTCLRYLTHAVGLPGDWRIIPTTANGQPAGAAYLRDSDGIHRAFGFGVLTVTETGIARILVFGGGTGLLAKFGLPRTSEG